MQQRIWHYLWLIVLLLPLAGCNLAPLLGPGIGAGYGAQQQTLLVETVVMPGTDQCRVVVTVNRPAQDVALDVQVAFEAGFRSAVTGEHHSEIQSARMLTQEVAQLSFDCTVVSSEIEVSGAYVVRATAFHSNTRQPFETATGALHVYADNAGRRQLMEEEAFARLYSDGYVPGTGPIRYHVALDEAPYPDHGVFNLRVDSERDGFAPTLDFLVGDGIQLFDGDEASAPVSILSQHTARAALESIAAGGSRVIAIPFRMAPGSLPGEYSLRVALANGQWAEVAPVFVAVRSDMDHAQSAWLNQVLRRAAALSPGTAWQPGDVDSVPPALPAGPTAAAPLGTPTATAPPPSVPQEQAAIVWDRQLTGYQGDRWRLWQQLEAELPMSWEQFNVDIMRHNPHLAADDYVFQPDKVYLIPRSPGPDMAVTTQ